jgi:hypothetical protein
VMHNGDINHQITSGGGAGSEPHSVRTARNLRRSAHSNVTGLFNSDISHRFNFNRPQVSTLIIDRYEIDAKVRFHTDSPRPAREVSGKREAIYQLSDKSVRNLKFVLRNVMHLMNSISTVTYPHDFHRDGRVIKKHIDILGKRLARKGIDLLWVMEFQARGAGHFHIFTTQPLDRQWLAQAWYEIVGSGDEKHLQAGTSVQYIVDEDDPRLEPDRARYKLLKAKGNRNAKRNFISRSEAISYMVAYYKKESQKEVPFGFHMPGRFWSASRGLLQCSKIVIKGDIRELKRGFRIVRKWYKAKLRGWNIPWKPDSKRTSFVLWDGMRLFRNLDALQYGETILPLQDAVQKKKKSSSTSEDCYEQS